MIRTDVPQGLYRVVWRESHGGGESFAAIGSDETGQRWIAPANWLRSAPLAGVAGSIESLLLLDHTDWIPVELQLPADSV